MIPKKIHVVWNHREVLNSQEPMIQHGLRNLIDLNPNWEVTLYTPNEIENYLRNNLTQIDYDIVRDKHFVSKTDIWRYLLMYEVGGLYIDLDRLCNRPLDPLIDQQTAWVCPTSEDYDITIDFLMSAPGNPVFRNAAQMYVTRRRQGWNHQYLLGPQTYMHAATLEICGEIVDINPGVEKFAEIRNKMAQFPFIKTYREVRYNDMIIYQGPLGDELESMKRDFYRKEGVQHWTGDW
jgi:mannosyltransferase OCH1-like enzyme